MGGGLDPTESDTESAYVHAQNMDIESDSIVTLPADGGVVDPSGGSEGGAQFANDGPHLALGGVQAEQDLNGVEDDIPNKQPAPGLFRLIGVRSDRQDLTFVEKVLLSQQDVAALFNLLAPGSLKSSSSGRWYMDLSSLLKKDVATVGLYGSKAIMKEVLTTEGFVQQQVLRDDSLQPGLYAAFSKARLVIFYWPPADKFSDARRGDISCNFIRYLLELCHTVYCCIEVEDGHEQISSVGPAAKKARTQRLQISVVQSSENDFKVQKGFRLSLPSFAATLASSFSWCEGLYRSAFLVPQKYTPANSFHRVHRSVGAAELPKLIEEWGDVSLDLSKLKADDVISFVKAAKLDGAAQLVNVISLLEEKKQAEAGKLANVEDYLSERKKEVLQVLGDAAVAYLRLNYPWEEQLFSKDRNSTDRQLHGDNIQDFMQYAPAARASEEDKQLLQKDFSELVERVVFVGCKVRLSINKDVWYTILEADGRREGAICYNQTLELSPPIADYSRVELVGGTGLVTPKHSFTIRAHAGAGWLPLPQAFRTKKIFSGVQFLEVESPRLVELMGRNARELIAPLEKQACLFDFLLGRKADLGIGELPGDVLLQRVLGSSISEYIPGEHVATCQEKLEQILSAEASMELERGETVIPMCLKVYEDHRRRFLSRIFDVAENVFFPALSSATNSELKEKREALKLSSQRQVEQHVADFVAKLAAEGGSRLKLVLEQFDGRGKHISIVFNQEVVSRNRVSWQAVELVPMKKDIEMQLSNPSHVIRPQFSDVIRVTDMDSTESKLMKVILLKSGVLIVVRNLEQPSMDIHFCNSLAAGLRRPIKTVHRGFDLVAFDEQTRFMALYEAGTAGGLIKVFKFDDKFASMEWNGVTICLSHYHGSGNITWMQFVPGKEEILIADDGLSVRVVEASYPGMMKPRAIQLPPSTLRLCATPDGVCLVAVCGDVAGNEEVALSAEVYRLDDTLEHIKTIGLDIAVKDVEGVQVAASSFGTQMYLLFHDAKEPELIRSLLLNVTVSSQSCQLQRSKAKAEPSTRGARGSSCHEIDYLYHVFDKYAVSPPLIKSARAVQLSLVADVRKGNHESLKQKYSGYARTVLQRLKQEKGKDFSRMQIHLDCQLYGQEPLKIQAQETNMGDFLRHLMCLVPVQVARAQNNSLRPLINGLEISQDLNYGDAVQLADMVQFGVYDAVLESWTGPVKVISSMGKQSSGKSYLLNHLSGSVLDVAGGRCTDGVWMTVRTTEDCLYVILDFEGLGSFERSEQEDMLLSIFNAAISNITIFNKKDFHLDKETEAVFERFQTGVSLIKDDEKLFKGLFYMAIKDVDAADVDELCEEFYSKIAQMCNKSKDNFLTRMYGGAVEVAAMPPFNRVEFHESIAEVAETVKEIEPVHSSGKSFLRDMKLVLAQICSKDWAPIDSKRIAFKVNLLRKHLKTALAFGSLATEDGKQLVDFESEEPISDGSLLLNAQEYPVPDTGLQLCQFAEMDVVSTILDQLVPEFEKVVPRKGKVDEEWHAALETFLGALADRRRARVLEWIKANTKAYASDGEVQKLLLEAAAAVAEFKEKLALCSCKCDKCFLRCILDKAHSAKTHSCKGSHRCSELCSYCADGPADPVERCNDVAGHQGPHDCKLKSHTCGELCCLRDKSSNCNEKCSLKVSHEGEHRCNSRQHMCKQRCSVPSCNNTCVSPVELTNHGRHACHEKMCIRQCQMPGCNRKCAVEDHFHSLEDAAVHLCGNEHQCRAKCEQRGICEVTTDIIKKTRTFRGRRSTFEYEHVSEQNGVTKECCIPIPPLELEHQGRHTHTTKPNAVHFCEQRCQGCGYYCNLPVDHAGLHDTNHGNMTRTAFVAESEEVEIQGRKYEWGESGVAEMCNLHCKARGRGHIHLTLCEQGQVPDGVCSRVKFPDGARHETRKYGPDTDVPKDEFTHAAYWKAMRFKDPCSPDDQQQFGLCDHFCPSAEHNSGTATRGILEGKTYCTEKLWHEPVPKLLRNTGTGYVTDDGHHFPCNHSREVPNHVIFVVDRSGSMSSGDIFPKLAKFPRSRLGCVYEAMVRFIRTRRAICPDDTMSAVLFNEHGTVGFERQAATEDQVDKLLRFASNGCTTYSSGISRVEEILGRSLSDSTIAGKPPAVIFLSDGGNNGGMDPVYCVKKLKDMEPRLVFHTIMFGTDPAQKILQDMANAGGGIFQVSIDELQLGRSFENLAKSLRSKVAALM